MSRPLFWVAVVFAALGVFFSTPAQALSPKIVFEKTEAYMPEAKEGATLTAKFPFKNTGGLNLIIDKVTPSCGCTASKFDKVVKPGQRGSVSLELDTTGINGSYHKTAVVATNDPSMPFVTLVMMGQTQSRIKIDKGRRIRLSGCLGEEVVAEATLSDPEGKPLFIGGIENPMQDYVEAKIKPLPGRKAYKLTIKSKAKQAVNFAGPLFLQIPGAAKVSVFVVAEIKGAYSVQPHEVYFGGVSKKGKAPVRGILIQRQCADKLTLDGLQFNREHFTVKENWAKPGEKLLLEVAPRLDKLAKGPFDEGIVIKASGEDFKVRLSGVVR